jgi:hypothetical protein
MVRVALGLVIVSQIAVWIALESVDGRRDLRNGRR